MYWRYHVIIRDKMHTRGLGIKNLQRSDQSDPGCAPAQICAARFSVRLNWAPHLSAHQNSSSFVGVFRIFPVLVLNEPIN